MRLFTTLTFLSFLLLCSSCATMGIRQTVRRIKKQVDLKVEEQEKIMYAQEPFDGIMEVLRNNTNEQLSLVLVHGVREKGNGHWDSLKIYATDSLGWTEKFSETRPYGDSTASHELAPLPWNLRETRYDTPSNNQVTVFEVNWSPITTGIKEFINKDDTSIYRTGVAQWLKKDLFLDAFVDFALYSNKTYREKMVKAIDITFRQIDPASKETVVIAGGLGGQLVMDWMNGIAENYRTLDSSIVHRLPMEQIIKALGDLPEYSDQKKTLQYLQSNQRSTMDSRLNLAQTELNRRRDHEYNIKKMFLISNQTPFTHLFTLETSEIEKALNEPDIPKRYQIIDGQLLQDFGQYLKFRKRKGYYQQGGSGDASLTVVSYFDPNDPFGFELPRETSHIPGLRIINVRRQQAAVWAFHSHAMIKVLKSIPLVNLDGLVYALIDETNARQELQLRVDGAQEAARSDKLMLGSIFKGATRQDSWVEFGEELFPEEEDKFSGEYGKKYKGLPLIKLIMAISKAGFGSAVQPFENASVDIRGQFDGIQKSIRENEMTQVVTIHGMRTKLPNHFDEMFELLTEELGFFKDPVYEKVSYLPDTPKDSISLRTLVYQNQNNHKLVLHSIYWSPLTTGMKNWLKERARLEHASRATGLLKREIITDGLGDVALGINGQVGTFRKLALKTFATLDSTRKAHEGPSKNYIISGSLGSWVLFDFVRDSIDNPLVLQGIRDMPEWYFQTNQLGLIGLTKIPAKIDIPAYHQWVIGESPGRNWATKFRTKMIAFNDPNDVLSFKLPDHQAFGLTHPKTVNVFLNSAGGMKVKMDVLVKYAEIMDDVLVWDKQDGLKRKQLVARKKIQIEECNSYQGPDILKPAYCRFAGRQAAIDEFKRQKCAWKTKRAAIEKHQRDNKDISNADMLRFLEAQGYSYNLLEPKRKHYMMKRKSFVRLSQSGLVMSALRSIASGTAEQDFVVDFATAHEGPATNINVVRMIALGSDSYKVNRTFRPQPK